MNKKLKTRKSLIIALSGLLALSGGSAIVSGFAWFEISKTADVGISNIAVMGVVDNLELASIKYFVGDVSTASNGSEINKGYRYGQGACAGSSYSASFVETNDDFIGVYSNPLFAMTYAIEIENSAAEPTHAIVRFDASDLTPGTSSDKHVFKSDGTTRALALADAIDIYTDSFALTNNEATNAAKADIFLSGKQIANSSNDLVDRFNYDPATTSYTIFDGDLAASSTTAILFTFTFSNNNATYLKPTKYTKFYSGDGSTTSFTLDHVPSSIGGVLVGGVATDAYTVTGNQITFNSAPASGTNNIAVYYSSAKFSTTFNGNGYDKTFTFSNTVTPYPDRIISVSVGGEETAAYAFNRNAHTITLDSIPETGTGNISIQYASDVDVASAPYYYIHDAVNGNSNPYMDLTFTIDQLLVQ